MQLFQMRDFRKMRLLIKFLSDHKFRQKTAMTAHKSLFMAAGREARGKSVEMQDMKEAVDGCLVA